MELTFVDICIRLTLATLFSGIIGWERESKTRPAGLRTHSLVCVGSAIIAIIQREVMRESFLINEMYPEFMGIIRSDPARLISQVISGIGFLGAGTIVVTKNSIRGLTSAASIWATSMVGVAVGMGYYTIASAGTFFIIFSLIAIRKIHEIPTTLFPTIKKIEIKYNNRQETHEFIDSYFLTQNIKVKSTNFSININNGARVYTDEYTIELPKGITYVDIAEGLADKKTIQQIHLINL